MSKIRLDKTTAQYIADAVREKTGKTEKLNLAEMAIELNDLESAVLTYGEPHGAQWVEDITQPYTFVADAGKSLDDFTANYIWSGTGYFQFGPVDGQHGDKVVRPDTDGYYKMRIQLNDNEPVIARFESPLDMVRITTSDNVGSLFSDTGIVHNYSANLGRITCDIDWATVTLTEDPNVKPVGYYYWDSTYKIEQLSGTFYRFNVVPMASESRYVSGTKYWFEQPSVHWGQGYSGKRYFYNNDWVAQYVSKKNTTEALYIACMYNGYRFDVDGVYASALDSNNSIQYGTDLSTIIHNEGEVSDESDAVRPTYGVFFQSEVNENAPADTGFIWIADGHTLEEFRADAAERELLVQPILPFAYTNQEWGLSPVPYSEIQPAIERAKWKLNKTVEGENTITISDPTNEATGYSKLEFTTQKTDNLSDYVYYAQTNIEGLGEDGTYLVMAKNEEDLPTSTLRSE